jgi:hypothetical protein
MEHGGEGEQLLGRGCKIKKVTTIRGVNPYKGELSHAPQNVSKKSCLTFTKDLGNLVCDTGAQTHWSYKACAGFWVRRE